MTEVEEKFKEILEQSFEVYSYSGRGMYGKLCLAINVSRYENIFGVVAQIVCDYTAEYGDSDLESLVSFFKQSKEDSMGLDAVLYFPTIEWKW